MLWYKAWLETRSRFLISLLGMVALCSFRIYHGDQEALSYTKFDYYYFVLHSGHSMLCIMWVLAVTLLMMGGLLREKAVGTALFTLSLPASRRHHMRVRILMGIVQAVGLAIIPWSIMFLIASIAGKTHSFGQAWFHIVLLIGGGLVFFGISLLVSSLVEGEYTAPVVSLGIMIAMEVVLDNGSFHAYSPLRFMTGTEYLDRHTWLLTGPIPWMHVGISMLIAVFLGVISLAMIQRQEF